MFFSLFKMFSFEFPLHNNYTSGISNVESLSTNIFLNNQKYFEVTFHISQNFVCPLNAADELIKGNCIFLKNICSVMQPTK